MAPRSVKWLAIDAASKSLSTEEEASNALRKLGKKPSVNLISIFGAARQGKSFLMNLLAGEENLFQISNSRTACTQGADLSGVFKPVSDFSNIRPQATEPGFRKACNTKDVLVGFADLEGQGDQDVTYDAKLMTPVLLSSAAVIFNWKGGLLKDQILDILAIAAKAAQCVDVSNEENEDESIFGHLHIVFRDWNFAREPNDQDRVFHDLFDNEKGFNATVQKQNSARGVVKAAFKSIKIWLLPPPVEKTDDLSKELNFELLQPSFVNEIGKLRGVLCEQLCEKTCFAGQRLNGPRLASLVPQLVDIVNSEETILPQSVFTSMMVSDASALVKELLKSLEEELNKALNQPGAPIAPNRFEVEARARELTLVEDFTEAFGDVSMTSIRNKMDEMSKLSDEIVTRAVEKNQLANKEHTRRLGEAVLDKAQGSLDAKFQHMLPMSEDELLRLGKQSIQEQVQKLLSLGHEGSQNMLQEMKSKLENTCDRELQSLVRENKLKQQTCQALVEAKAISASDQLREKLTKLNDQVEQFKSEEEIKNKIQTLQNEALEWAKDVLAKELSTTLSPQQLDAIHKKLQVVSKSFEASITIALKAHQRFSMAEERERELQAQLDAANQEREKAITLAKQKEEEVIQEKEKRESEVTMREQAIQDSENARLQVSLLEKAREEATLQAMKAAKKEAEIAELAQQRVAELEEQLRNSTRQAEDEAERRRRAEEVAAAEARELESAKQAADEAKLKLQRLAEEESKLKQQLTAAANTKETEHPIRSTRKRRKSAAESSEVKENSSGNEDVTMEVDEQDKTRKSKRRRTVPASGQPSPSKRKVAATPKRKATKTASSTPKSSLEEIRRRAKEEQEKRLQSRIQKLKGST